MRKPVQFILAAVIVLLAGATAVLFQQQRKASNDYTQAMASGDSARADYAQAINTVAEIQDSLNAIGVSDTSVRLMSEGYAAERGLSNPRRHQALDRIAVLKESVERARARITALESSVKKSGLKITGLQRMIANLKQNVAEKETMVAALTTRVDSLTTRVTGLETTVAANQDTIQAKDQFLEERRRTLATVYVAVGSKKDLENSGVLVARGGMLGIGKTLAPSARFNPSVYTALDTDQETVIHTTAKKVEVVSPQPVGSYQLVAVGDQMELHITDPAQFRTVKQVVIMTR